MFVARHSGRSLLAEAQTATQTNATAAAANALGATVNRTGERTARSQATGASFQSRRRDAIRKPLSDRFDVGGFPHKALNPKYSALVVGQHLGRIVYDRRAEMMAVLSATNLIREIIAGEGRILLMSNDKRLEAEMLAAARDCGEFTHAGKWPPGGFTNRPQVSVVPQLPSLVISLEPDNHVLMREAFQMCIPRVAPVNILAPRSDFEPEVPLHATEYTLHEKKRMLNFFASFIAKLKFGQMPVGDTQSRFKEYAQKMMSTYASEARDIPEPYLKAATRPYDSRPDLQYGVKPAHVAYNEQRSFEESLAYHRATLQPANYLDAAATEDDIIARDLPPIDTYDIGDTVEYQTLTERSTRHIEPENGTYVKDVETGKVVLSEHERDYEYEELMADNRARQEAGVRLDRQWNLPADQDPAVQRAMKLEREIARTPDADLREQYEEWYKDRQDAANDFIPYAEKTGYDLNSKFAQPSEHQTQQRLWKLKQRVRANQQQKDAAKTQQRKAARSERGVGDRNIPSHLFSTPVLDAPTLFGTSKKKFSTLARSSRGFSTAATPASVASVTEEAASSPTAPTPRRFTFPRFLLPAFIALPFAAYLASMAHTDEDTKSQVSKDQQEWIESFKRRFGFGTVQAQAANEKQQEQESISPPRSDLISELASLESSLKLLLDARAFIFESIPVERRDRHKTILDEIELRRQELELRITELKKALRM